ncbi:MAG TPA: lysylphosphatidylglycerol synthase transmembrane domain-containing protein [Clostridia bacterium]|nr:lysylphosphatidylglycerol synthase transmembrane domain-containing protein [Clostridia bacterium]
MKTKGILKIIAGAAVTVISVVFAVKALGDVDFYAVFHAQINWGMAVVSAVLFVLSTFFRGLAYTRGIDRNLTAMQSWRIVAVGNASNLFLPLRGGEGIRFALFPEGYSAIERTRLTMVPGVADIAAILAVSLSAVIFADFRDPVLVDWLNLIAAVFVSVVFVVVLVLYILPKTRSAVRRHMSGDVLMMSFWVALSWVIVLLSIWVGILSFGADPNGSGDMTIAVFAGTSLALFIPSSPGGIGVFEYSVILSLGSLGMPPAPAKVIGILLHLIQYASLLPAGIILYLTGMDPNKRKKFRTGFRKRRRRRPAALLKK